VCGGKRRGRVVIERCRRAARKRNQMNAGEIDLRASSISRSVWRIRPRTWAGAARCGGSTKCRGRSGIGEQWWPSHCGQIWRHLRSRTSKLGRPQPRGNQLHINDHRSSVYRPLRSQKKWCKPVTGIGIVGGGGARHILWFPLQCMSSGRGGPVKCSHSNICPSD
jgi:hypothetical protein